MAFFKFRQRGQPPADVPRRAGAKEAAAAPQETIDSVRRRARHRLVGAAVLVLLAIIGFPLLFDTQPRPVAVNAPITIPDKDKAAPLKAPDALPANASLGEREEVVASGDGGNARPSVPAAPTRNALADKPPASARDARPDASTEPRAPAAAAREDEARARKDEQARAKREQEARAKREAEQRAKREEAARARALLEDRNSGAADKPAAAADKPGRFIVQVGAFADDTAVREARHKAERTGVKTYTQVVDTKDGKRTRVRVGPFASREEADKAAAALKKAGLAGAVLSL